MKKKAEKTRPVCSKCGATGNGVEFRIFSKFGFGRFCVPCEEVYAGNPMPAKVAAAIKEATK